MNAASEIEWKNEKERAVGYETGRDGEYFAEITHIGSHTKELIVYIRNCDVIEKIYKKSYSHFMGSKSNLSEKCKKIAKIIIDSHRKMLNEIEEIERNEKE